MPAEFTSTCRAPYVATAAAIAAFHCSSLVTSSGTKEAAAPI